MKHYLILLFILCSTLCAHSQVALQEFVIVEEDNPPVIIHQSCTPDVGVIVFYTSIPDLKFSLPDTPSRLKNISPYDNETHSYVLCIQPTDTKIGGITKYTIKIIAKEYKDMPALEVGVIKAGITKYFSIKQKQDWLDAYNKLKEEIENLKASNNQQQGKQPVQPPVQNGDNKIQEPVVDRTPVYVNEKSFLNFTFKGIDFPIKVYLGDYFIGETDFNRGFQLNYAENLRPGTYKLRLVWAKNEWSNNISINGKKDFVFEYKSRKTGLGYKYNFELVQ